MPSAPAQPTTRAYLIRVYYLRSHEPSLNESSAERTILIIIFYSADFSIATNVGVKRMYVSSQQ